MADRGLRGLLRDAIAERQRQLGWRDPLEHHRFVIGRRDHAKTLGGQFFDALRRAQRFHFETQVAVDVAFSGAIALLAGGLYWRRASTLGAYLVVRRLMGLDWTFLPTVAVAVALGAMVLTLAFGLAGTLAALRQRPLALLRNE